MRSAPWYGIALAAVWAGVVTASARASEPISVPAPECIEPLVVFAPRGPLLVRVELHQDGKPYAIAQRERIAALFRSLDADVDGRVTWSEAAISPRFLPGMFTFRFGAEGLRPERLAYYARFFRRKFDTNQNGELDLVELVTAHAQSYTTPHFVTNSYIQGSVGNQLLDLLDVNRDGALSIAELAELPQRLASRDRNANELVEFAELPTPAPAGRAATYGVPIVACLVPRPEGAVASWQAQLQQIIALERTQAMMRARELERDPRAQDRARAAQQQAAAMEAMAAPQPAPQRPTDRELHAQAMFDLWQRHYAPGESLTADRIPAFASRFSELDADGDLTLSRDELVRLVEIEPHLVVELDLASQGLRCRIRQADPARFDSTRADLLELDDASGLATAREGASLVRFSGQRQTIDSLETAKAFIGQRDANRNGMLERNEFEASEEQPAWTFALWDGDQNGKVTPEEINAMGQFSLSPFDIYFNGRVAEQPLLQMLDASGDSRLSVREMRLARQRLLTLDRNGDGALSNEELPQTINLEGTATGPVGQLRGGTPIFLGRAQAPNRSAGPDWFVRMDRNGDGDVSEREFLGTPEKFRELDANGDGLIEPAEAN